MALAPGAFPFWRIALDGGVAYRAQRAGGQWARERVLLALVVFVVNVVTVSCGMPRGAYSTTTSR